MTPSATAFPLCKIGTYPRSEVVTAGAKAGSSLRCAQVGMTTVIYIAAERRFTVLLRADG